MADNSYLYQEQYELEIEAVEEGLRRYERSRSAREPGSQTPELQMIVKAMDSFIPAIEELQRGAANKRSMAGVRLWGVPILSVCPKKLALITLVSMVNTSGETNAAVFTSIAEAVQLERYYELVKSKRGDALTRAKRFRKNWSKDDLHQLRRKMKITDRAWTPQIKMWVGSVLGETALQHTDLFEKSRVWVEGGHLAPCLKLKQSVVTDLAQQHENLALLKPRNLPMVVPPRKPTTLYDGNYLIGEDFDSCKSPILKKSYKTQSKISSLEELGLHADAPFIMGQTEWRPNQRILEVQDTIFKSNSGLAGMMSEELLALPARPGPGATEDEWNDYNLRAHTIHTINHTQTGARVKTLFNLSEARRFSKYPSFYHPWENDTRGRMYPQDCLSPQGSDQTRSLIEFANPKPLGPDGYRWLSIHLANSIGEDKSTFDDRYEYVHGMKSEIQRWARDPLDHTGWAETENPFKTLAAAFEWSEAVELRDRSDYLSRVRVEQDGSTNGLQHLSALARDLVGAKATNLSPSDKPQDLYSQVLREVQNKITEDINSWRLAGAQDALSTPESEWRAPIAPFYLQAALNWEGNVERKTVKRGTMTTPYAVTPQGIRDQLVSDGFLKDLPGSTYYNANYMRDCIVHGVGKVVTKSKEVMHWLQRSVAIAYEEGKEIHWTNPAGMRVDQAYFRAKTRRIVTASGEYTYRVTDIADRKLMKNKQVSSVAPNYIHSIDAAHMSSVVYGLWEEGIRDMAMIHDSYAVHACHVPQMRAQILENFVEIHKEPLLDLLHEEVSQQLESEVPAPPSYGDFDITSVLDSPYAFH